MIRLWFKILLPTIGSFFALYFLADAVFSQVPTGIDAIALTYNRARIFHRELDEQEWPAEAAQRQSILDRLSERWHVRLVYCPDLPPDQVIVDDGPDVESYALLMAGTWIRMRYSDGDGTYLVVYETEPVPLTHVRFPLAAGGWVAMHATPWELEQYSLLAESEQQTEHGFLLLLAGGALFLAGGIAGFIVYRMQVLRARMAHILAGNINARVPVRSRDLIGQLGGEFNAVLDRLQQMIDAQRNLLRAVAHELRTPMARIDLAIQLAQEEGASNAHIDGIRDDLDDMDHLVRSLTRLMRIEHRSQEAVVACDMSVMVGECVLRYGALYPQVAIDDCVETGLELPGRLDDLRMAVGNLLANALRHAVGRVRVTARREDGMAEVRIDDDGPGIPVDQREQVRQAFACGDPSHNKRLGGIGLGLTIVETVMRSHRGSLSIGDSDLGGAAVIMRWPLAL